MKTGARASDAAASVAMISRPRRLSPPTDVRVNVSNWQQPQNVRWAFRHMREFIPTQLISAGTSSPRPLPATDAPLGNPSVVRLDESHSTVQDILAGTLAASAAGGSGISWSTAIETTASTVSSRREAVARPASLKSIVLELMATDFISRWDKSRMSFAFDDWLVRPAPRPWRKLTAVWALTLRIGELESTMPRRAAGDGRPDRWRFGVMRSAARDRARR